MLDMGFIHPIRRIAAETPGDRQTLLFSATMSKEIRALAHSLLSNPTQIAVDPVSTAAPKIEQSLFMVPKGDKQSLLNHLLTDGAASRVVVFTKTKHGADRVAERLHRSGVTALAIHGNQAQNARTRALDAFRPGKARARGDRRGRTRPRCRQYSHVVNFDLPMEPEAYVHRTAAPTPEPPESPSPSRLERALSARCRAAPQGQDPAVTPPGVHSGHAGAHPPVRPGRRRALPRRSTPERAPLTRPRHPRHRAGKANPRPRPQGPRPEPPPHRPTHGSQREPAARTTVVQRPQPQEVAALTPGPHPRLPHLNPSCPKTPRSSWTTEASLKSREGTPCRGREKHAPPPQRPVRAQPQRRARPRGLQSPPHTPGPTQEPRQTIQTPHTRLTSPRCSACSAPRP